MAREVRKRGRRYSGTRPDQQNASHDDTQSKNGISALCCIISSAKH